MKLKKIEKRVLMAMVVLYTMVWQIQLGSVYAASKDKGSGATDMSAVTQPLENLKLLMTSIVGGIGAVILVKNILEFANAFQNHDSSSMLQGIKGIVAGVIMAAGGTTLTILGITN